MAAAYDDAPPLESASDRSVHSGDSVGSFHSDDDHVDVDDDGASLGLFAEGGFGGFAPQFFGGAKPDGVNMSIREGNAPRTWDGVFLPVSLASFGEVMFLKLPWCVGQAGLYLTLAAVCICFLLSGLTLASLAAMSTNGLTQAGGPYMMASRTLGPQIGLAIGILFVIANVIASATYLVGTAPAVVHALQLADVDRDYNNQPYWTVVGIGTVLLLILLFVAVVRVEKYFRVIAFALTVVAIVDIIVTMSIESRPVGEDYSGFTGFNRTMMENNLHPRFDNAVNFQTIVAVLLPGATGILAGITLSGELRHASKAMPRGIGYAWVISFFTYVLLSCLVASSFDGAILRTTVAPLHDADRRYLFAPGEICACFASVLAGLSGSVRVITGMSRDDLVPILAPIAHTLTQRPRLALLIVWALIQCIMFIGARNKSYNVASAWAAVVFCSVFFALNMGTFLSRASGVSSFRPTYAFFNKITALAGAAGSVVVMFFVNPLGSVGAIAVLVFLVIGFEALHDPQCVVWGDAAQPIVFHFVRKWLLMLDVRKEHPRHWRPNVLQLTTDVERSQNLVHFANNLKKGGLYQLAVVVKGDFNSACLGVARWKSLLFSFIRSSGIKGFPAVTYADSLRGGLQQLLMLCGLGGMRPNTILLSIDDYCDRAEHRSRAFLHVSLRSSVRPGGLPRPHRRSVHGGSMLAAPPISSARFLSSVDDTNDNAAGAGGGAAAAAGSSLPRRGGGGLWVMQSAPNTSSRFAPAGQGAVNGDPVSGPLPPRSSATDTNPTASAVASPVVPPSSRSIVSVPEEEFPPSAGGGGGPAPPLAQNAPAAEEQQQQQKVAARHRRRSSVGSALSEPLLDRAGTPPLGESGASFADGDGESSPQTKVGHYHTRRRSPSPAVDIYTSTGARSNPSQPNEAGGATPRNVARKSSTAAGAGDDSNAGLGRRVRVFTTNRGDADEAEEEAAIRQMGKLRADAVLNGTTPDVLTYRDEVEFAGIVADACQSHFSVLLARGFSALDRADIAACPQGRSAYIDLWLPGESDPILFLTAHCLSQTSVWASHAQLRIVGLSWTQAEADEAREVTEEILRHHRIKAEVTVLVLEERCEAIFDAIRPALLQQMKDKRRREAEQKHHNHHGPQKRDTSPPRRRHNHGHHHQQQQHHAGRAVATTPSPRGPLAIDEDDEDELAGSPTLADIALAEDDDLSDGSGSDAPRLLATRVYGRTHSSHLARHQRDGGDDDSVELHNGPKGKPHRFPSMVRQRSRDPSLGATVELPRSETLDNRMRTAGSFAVLAGNESDHMMRRAFAASIADPVQRAITLNHLIRDEVKRNERQTKLVMLRTDEPPPSMAASCAAGVAADSPNAPQPPGGAADAQEAAEAEADERTLTAVSWVTHVDLLTDGLPPTVLFCGGGSMNATQEW